MPIPIADIPNAPQAGPALGLTSVPQPSLSIAGVAGTLTAPTLAQGAFDGAAEALQSMGQAIGQVAQVPTKVKNIIDDNQRRRAQFQDNVSLATYNRQMTEAFETYRAGLDGVSEDQWVPGWQKQYSELSEKFAGDLSFSEAGRQQLLAENQQFLSRTNSQLITSANRKAVDRGTGELLAQADRQFEFGDDEAAYATIGKLVDLGAMRRDQAQAKMESWKEIRNENALTAAMQSNPKMFHEDIQEFIKTGKSEVLEDNFTGPEKAMKLRDWEGRSGAFLRGIQVDQGNEIHNGILEGSIIDEPTLRQAAGDNFDEKQVQRWVKLMNSNVKYDPEVTSKLRTDIAGYSDIAKDDTDLSKYNELRVRIESTIAKDLQGPLATELYQAYSDQKEGKLAKPSTRLRGEMFSKIDELGAQGLLTGGKTGRRGRTNERKGEKASDIIDKEADAMVFTTVENLKNDTEQFFKEHPDASPDDAMAWFKSKLDAPAASAAADMFAEQETKTPFFGAVRGGLGMPVIFTFGAKPAPTPKPEEIREKAGKLSPASVRFNNPGAMYPGESSAKFGSTRTETIGGGHKIAVFDNPEDGAAAQFDLLDRAYTGKTLRDAITKWSGGNSVPTYLKVIKESTGLDDGTVITKAMLRDPDIGIPLLQAMARQEAGRDYPLSLDQWKSAQKRAFNS